MESRFEQLERRANAAEERLKAAEQHIKATGQLAEKLDGFAAGMTDYSGRLDRINIAHQKAIEMLADTLDEKLKTEADMDLDAALVSWMNRCFLSGKQAWRGEKLLAALMARSPRSSALGMATRAAPALRSALAAARSVRVVAMSASADSTSA